MIIEIDDDLADSVVVASLIDSYIQISRDVKNESSWHEDDIAAWKELLPALKLVASWYCLDFDVELKKAKKEK